MSGGDAHRGDMNALNDFDFLVGDWIVHHHKLQQRLANCQSWWDFDGTCSFWKILGGLGNVDDNVIDRPTGSYGGASVRLFDRVRFTWSDITEQSARWEQAFSPTLTSRGRRTGSCAWNERAEGDNREHCSQTVGWEPTS